LPPSIAVKKIRQCKYFVNISFQKRQVVKYIYSFVFVVFLVYLKKRFSQVFLFIYFFLLSSLYIYKYIYLCIWKAIQYFLFIRSHWRTRTAKLIKNIFLKTKPVISSYLLPFSYEKSTAYRGTINHLGILYITTFTSVELISVSISTNLLHKTRFLKKKKKWWDTKCISWFLIYERAAADEPQTTLICIHSE